MDYIGHIITNEGLNASPTKIAAVQKMRQPHNKGGVQRFLGLVTYSSKFIPNMSEISAPLGELLASGVEWHWDKQQQKSFEALKTIVHRCYVAVTKKNQSEFLWTLVPWGSELCYYKVHSLLPMHLRH